MNSKTSQKKNKKYRDFIRKEYKRLFSNKFIQCDEWYPNEYKSVRSKCLLTEGHIGRHKFFVGTKNGKINGKNKYIYKP